MVKCIFIFVLLITVLYVFSFVYVIIRLSVLTYEIFLRVLPFLFAPLFIAYRYSYLVLLWHIHIYDVAYFRWSLLCCIFYPCSDLCLYYIFYNAYSTYISVSITIRYEYLWKTYDNPILTWYLSPSLFPLPNYLRRDILCLFLYIYICLYLYIYIYCIVMRYLHFVYVFTCIIIVLFRSIMLPALIFNILWQWCIEYY